MTRAAALSLLLLTACGGGELTFVAYNAGLAVNFVDGAVERLPGTSAAIGAIEADVVCLQEVWLPNQVDAVVDAASAYAHTDFPEPSQEIGSDPACADGELDSLYTCITESCTDVCADELVDCVFSNCAFPFLGLEDNCMRCVQANIGGDIDGVVSTCESETTEYAYGGSFGTGVLSKHPIVSSDQLVFASTTNRRNVTHHVIDTPGPDTDVYCTHLTADLGLIPYPRAEGSWPEEQTAQIEDMLAWIDETAQTDRVVLMGDMNTGPETDDARAELGDNWDLFAASRFTAPYVNRVGDCTFCASNALSSEEDGGVLIDHVLVDGFSETIAASRVLDEEIDIETCGETVPGAHSDHYGVSVTVKR